MSNFYFELSPEFENHANAKGKRVELRRCNEEGDDTGDVVSLYVNDTGIVTIEVFGLSQKEYVLEHFLRPAGNPARLQGRR